MITENSGHLVNLKKGGRASTRNSAPEYQEQPVPGVLQNIKDLQKEEAVRVPVQSDSVKNEPDTIIEWKAHNFLKIKKTKKWYAGLILFGGICVAFAIYTNNSLFVIIVTLAIATILVRNNVKPKLIDFAVKKRGILVEKRIYEYSNLKSFVIYQPDDKRNELIIFSKKMFMPTLKIPLENQNLEKIREIFLKFLPEEQHYEESLTDVLENTLGI